MGWGWRCGEQCWGPAGRRTGSPPAGRGSRTLHILSCTYTGTWQRNRCCLLFGKQNKNGRMQNEFFCSLPITCFLISSAFPSSWMPYQQQGKNKNIKLSKNNSRISLASRRHACLQRYAKGRDKQVADQMHSYWETLFMCQSSIWTIVKEFIFNIQA